MDGGGCSVESVKCECCGLTEECTAGYIVAVDLWAVKDEMGRCCSASEGEALDRHMRVCRSFRSSMTSPAEGLISAVKHLLIRSFDSPRSTAGQPGDYHRRQL